jgi:DNA mismatch repair protein MutH
MLQYLNRDEAVAKLRLLEGVNLRELAPRYGVTVFTPEGKLNKGWVGHVIEAYLGLPRNSLQTGDFYDDDGPWELKTVSLRQKGGVWVPKETLAVTMISESLELPEFYESNLFHKLRRMVVVGRAFISRSESDAQVVFVHPFDLESPENEQLLAEIKADYEEVRALRNQPEGYYQLTGKMGVWVQPRTKGAGHGTRSRAFYARKKLVAVFLRHP